MISTKGYLDKNILISSITKVLKKIYYFKFNDLNRKNHDINLKFTENNYQCICLI
jgi:hypothetical protein